MTDYQQNPNEAPRARHARPRARQASPQAGRQAVLPQQTTPQGRTTARTQQQVPYAQQAARAQQQVPQAQQQAVRAQQQPRTRQAAPQARPQSGYAQPAAYSRYAQQGGYQPVTPNGPNGKMPAGKPQKKKGGPWRVVFWIALVVFVVAALALGAIAFSYWQGQRAYDEVADQAFSAPADIEATALADITVDWDALRAINPDTVGWIYIPGTAVNYPIVHTTDDEKYLTHDFNGQQTWGATYGSIFLSAANAADFSDVNNIIYGHHLNNGSMFAAIAGFDDAAQFNAHRTVYLLTPQGNYRLSSFSLIHCAADDPLVQIAFATDAERVAYVQDKIDRSTVAASDIPQATDITQMFALATCDNLPSAGRYVLFCSVAETTVASSGTTVAASSATSASDATVNPQDALAINDATKETETA